MNTPILIAMLVVGAALAFVVGRFVYAYRKQRGARLVSCPETHRPAAVEVDAVRAALAATRGRARVSLSACSRWPEREGCGQECLSAIAAAPDGCLVRSMLVRWYDERACALCGSDMDAAHWYSHQPAFLDSERRTLEWKDVPVENLPEILETHQPVCWNCHVIESVIREHPDRVVFRP